MTLSQSLSVCFKKAFVTTGRASRSEFWWTWLIFALLYIGYIVCFICIKQGTYTMSLLMLPILAGILVVGPMIYSVTVRRLQDTNHSGWFSYIGLIPIIGWIVLIIVLAKPGTPGQNKYGEEISLPTDK